MRRENANLVGFGEVAGEGIEGVSIDNGWEVGLFVDGFDETELFRERCPDLDRVARTVIFFRRLRSWAASLSGSVISSGWSEGPAGEETVTRPAPLR